GVEEVQALWVDGELQLFMHLGTRDRLDRGDHRHRADRDIEQDLRAEPLDDLDHRRNIQLGGIAVAGDPHILGPDADRYRFADIRPDPVVEVSWDFEPDALPPAPRPPFPPAIRPFAEFTGREPM